MSKQDSKTFCIMPFIHQNIKQEGKVSACWRYPDRIGDYRTNTLQEIWNNKETRELRRALSNNEKPDGCRSCWDFENSGVKSTRMRCNEVYAQSYGLDYEQILTSVRDDYSALYAPKSIEIRFDNTCNLRCRHCSPTYSSQWENLAFHEDEIKDFFHKHGAARLEKKHISLPEERFQDFLELIPHLSEVLIAGGEPLQQKRHYIMLEKMMPYAKGIRLSYNSNLTRLTLKDWDVLDYWPAFKEIELRVSIDGYPEIYEYFRTGGNINVVESNIKKLQQAKINLNLNTTITVCIYNITRIVEIAKYITSLHTWFHTSMVQYPAAINPKILPKKLKDTTTLNWKAFLMQIDSDPMWEGWNDKEKELQKEKIKQHGNFAIDYMNSEDLSDNIEDMWGYINVLDKYNKTNFLDVYPEFKTVATAGI
jgi:radical SAM protein with 4Fe4S-binding SPASM domain